MKILILTLGSRGDVQPYVALGKGLLAAGNSVTLATGKGFDSLLEGSGLQYASLNADVLQLMEKAKEKGSVEGKNVLGLMKIVMPMLRRVMEEAWEVAQDAQAVIYHPKALAGYHIADRLGVPGFLALPTPMYTPTRAFPNPALPVRDLGGFFNRLTYPLVLKAASAPYQKIVNTWRRETLGLPPAKNERELHGRPVPRLYPCSPHVIPPPADWDPDSILTGYWFLDREQDWEPPADLLAFLNAGPAPVYVGFGSMAAHDAAQTTQTVLQALDQAGQRAVLATGWGGMNADMLAGTLAGTLPDSIYMLESAPHDWLFERVSAVIHHGGAGTVAAGLRAGKPTLVCPFLADQTFWGWRVSELGVGPDPLPYKRWTAKKLASAIRQTAEDGETRQRAEALGEKIRAEDGVSKAVEIILGTVKVQPQAARRDLQKTL